VQSFNDLAEVCHIACQPVNFVKDDDVHLPGFNIRENTPKCRPFHISTGVAAILIASGQRLPSFLALTEDERLACLVADLKTQFQAGDEVWFPTFASDGSPRFLGSNRGQ